MKDQKGQGLNLLKDIGRMRLPPTRILITLPLIFSVLTTVFLLSRFHNIAKDYSSSSPSLQTHLDPTSSHTVFFSGQTSLNTQRSSCLITVAAWRHYARVQTLFDSIQLNSPTIRCFVWFVADSAIRSDIDGSLEKVRLIQERVAGIMDIVTVDILSKKLVDFSPFTRLSFTSRFTEDQCVNFITPFALKYTLQEYHIDSVIYLDRYLWVNNSLEPVQKKLDTQSITFGPSLNSELENAPHLSFIALNGHATTANKYLITWIQHVCTFVSQPFHVIGAFEEEEDWDLLHDPSSQSTFWNVHLPQGRGADRSSESRRQSILIRYDSSTEKNSQYGKRLEALNYSYFEQIRYGFSYFSDGSVIEPWMIQLYESMMTPVEQLGDGTINPRKHHDNIFTRISFQERIYRDPFLATLPKSHGNKESLTFMQWLLCGPSSKAVDMEGKFYFSEIEENVWNSLHFYPMNLREPLGDDFYLWKTWFEREAENSDSISKYLQRKVLSMYSYHEANHVLFHRSGSSDIGLNVIGWHGGIFGLAKAAVNIYQATVSVGIQANAIQLLALNGQSFIHPRLLPYKISRSCSQQVNLFMVNADYTPQVKQEIPEIIWRHKFNIGFWFWELDVFPEKHMENLKYYDQIWVASKFVADSITMSKGYDGTPVHVIPIPLMRDVQHSGEIDGRTQPKNHAGILQSLLDELRDSFVFLTVFDFGSCGQRKNPAASIRAFLEAFPLEMQSSQSYRLVVKSHHGSPSEMDEMRALARNDTRIHFVSDILTDQEHTTLQKRADCFVSLHRSEGYGMNILEEMSNGIPVIVTNYSGNVDFFPPMNKLSGICVFPIPYRLVTLTTTLAVVYLEGNRWADPNHDSAVMAMRNVVRNDCKRKHGKEIAQLVWTNFGIKAVGNKIKRILRASWPEIQKKDISMKLAHETNPMILVGSEVASG